MDMSLNALSAVKFSPNSVYGILDHVLVRPYSASATAVAPTTPG